MPHLVTIKLQKLVPYFEAGQMLGDELPYRVYRFYKYLNDIIVAIVGLGLPPAVALVAKAFVSPPKADSGESGVWATLMKFPPVFGVTCIILLFAWIAMKVFLNQQNCEQRNALAESTEKQFAVFRTDLEILLQKSDPMADLNIIQGKLHEIQALCMTNGVWPWRPFPQTTAFQSRCAATVKFLTAQYGSDWASLNQDPNLRT